MATTGLGGALASLALGGGNAWGQVGPNTLPTGGQVVSGAATINQQNQNTLNINQSTDRAVINWSSFDVGQDATVNFYQPNSGSWTLNRVTSSTAPSQILGSVNANGNIMVINPNGVMFGQGSRVDVNGLIATSANISNQNFMAGNFTFDQPGNPNAMIVNQGDITVKDAGLVAFVAPGVSNSGTITANLGRVSLASGNKFTVDLYGDRLVSIAVGGETTAAPVDANGNPVDALVSNSGQIIADGGRVQMTAKQASQIVDNAINMSGVVRAQSAYVAQNGDIVLDAGPNGNVVVSGTLDVSGRGAGQTGGTVTVTGKNDVKLTATAKIDASGSAGGGRVKIGGDYQGKGATPTAKRTLVATGAAIDVSAIEAGDGGTVIVWADDHTVFAGAIQARGGAAGGNGGLVETSGKNLLNVAASASVDAAAPHGAAGSWLLDPRHIRVATDGGAVGTTDVDEFDDLAGIDAVILPTTIEAALDAGTDVTLQATGNIRIEESIVVSGGAPAGGDLTLQAGSEIAIDAGVLISLNGDFTAIANDSQAGTGGNRGGSDIGGFGSTGATISATGNVSITVDPATGSAGGGDNYAPGFVLLGDVTAGGAVSVTATASTVWIYGHVSAGAGIQIDSDEFSLLGPPTHSGGLSTSAGDIVIDSANWAVFQPGTSISTGGGDITVTAGAMLQLIATTVRTNGGDLNLTAGDAGVGSLIVNGASDVATDGGDVFARNNSTDSASFLTFSGALHTGGGAISATAVAGDMILGGDFFGSGVSTSGGDITLESAGSIIVGASGALVDLGAGTLYALANRTGNAVAGGQFTFDSVSFNDSITAAAIVAEGEAISVAGTLVATGAGGISLVATGEGLPVAATRIFSAALITTTGGGTIAALSSDGIELSGRIESNGADIVLNASTDPTAGPGLFAMMGTGVVDAGAGDLLISAGDFANTGSVSPNILGTGTLTVRRSADAGTMVIGGNGSIPQSGDMTISQFEVGYFGAGFSEVTFGHATMSGDLIIRNGVTTSAPTTFLTGGTIQVLGAMTAGNAVTFSGNDFDIQAAINGTAALRFVTTDPALALGVGAATGGDAIIDAAEYALIYGGPHSLVTFGSTAAAGEVVFGSGIMLAGATRAESASEVSVVGVFDLNGNALTIEAPTVNLAATIEISAGTLTGIDVGVVNVSDPDEDGDADGLVGDIRQALIIVQDGGTINVDAGLYEFDSTLTVSKSVSLLGAGANVTHLDFTQTTGIAINLLTDTGSGIVLSGFDIRGDDSVLTGVSVNDAVSDVTISDNLIRGVGSNIANNGIVLDGAPSFLVTGNTITGIGASPGVGILVDGSGTISGNTIGNIADDAGYAAAPSVALAGRGIEVVNAAGGVLIDDNLFAPGAGQFVRIGLLVNSGVSGVTFNADDSSFGDAIVSGNTFSNGNVGAYYIDNGAGNSINLTVSQSIGVDDLAGLGGVPNSFARFDAAIDLADVGATLTATAGDWYEALDVDKSLTIRGAQAGVSAVSGGRTPGGAGETSIISTGIAVTVRANDVTVDGLDIMAASAGVVVETTSGDRSNIIVANSILRGSGVSAGIAESGGAWIGANTISGNDIDGFGQGISTSHDLAASGSFVVAGNRISSTGTAIFIDGAQGVRLDGNTIASSGSLYAVEVQSSDVSGVTAATITGNLITNSGGGLNGAIFRDASLSGGGSLAVTIGAGNTISASGAALVVSGPDTSIVGNTLNDLAFVGNPNLYVALLNGALDNQLIDGRNASYDGLLGSAATPAEVIAIEARIIDVAENSAVGDIVISNTLIVVDGGGLQAIQDALDFGGDDAGITVIGTGGPYAGTVVSANAPTGTLTIWADDVTLQGSGAPVLDFADVGAGATSAILIAGSGATLAGFDVQASAQQTVSAVLIVPTASNATVTGNSIQTGIDSASGVVVQADNALISGNLIEGTGGNTGAGHGVFVDSSAIIGGTITNVAIVGNAIADFDANGIYVDPVFGPVVLGNTVTGVGDNGIEIDAAVGDVTVGGNTVSATGLDGIYIHDSPGSLYVGVLPGGSAVGNTIDQTAGDGIRIELASGGGNVSVWYNRIGQSAAIGGDGIDIAGGAVAYGGNLLLLNNRIDRTAGNGILVDDVASSGGLNVSGNIIAGGGAGSIGAAGIAVTESRFNQVYFDDNVVGQGSTVTGAGILVDDVTVTTNLQIEQSVLGTEIQGSGIQIADLTGDLLLNENTATGVGLSGLEAIGVTGTARIEDNIVDGPGQRGINVGSVDTGVSVTGNSVGGTSDHAIAVGASTGGLLIQANDVNSSVFVQQVAGGILIDANTLTSGGSYGIHTESTNAGDLTITGNRITGYNGNGIDVTGTTNGDLLVQDNVLNTIGGHGIVASGVMGAVEVRDNTVETVAGTGISIFATGAAGALIDGNIVTDIGGTGILATGSAATISGNTIANVAQSIAGNGISSSANDVWVEDNFVDDVFLGHGISLGGNAGNTVTGNSIATGSDSTIGLEGISIADVTSAVVEDNVLAVNDGAGGIGGSGIRVGVPGGPATIQRNTLGDADTTIVGSGIAAFADAGTTVADNSIQNVGEAGILAAAGSVTVATNSLLNIGGVGISITNGNPPVGALVMDNDVENTGSHGIAVDGIAGDVLIEDNDLRGIGDDGINASNIGGRLDILRNVVEGAGSNGVRADGITGGAVVMVSDNTVDTVGGNGIDLSGVTGSLGVTGNVVGGTGAIDGIGIEVTDSTILDASIAGNTIDNTGGTGLRLESLTAAAPGGAVLIDGNFIAGSGAVGDALNEHGIEVLGVAGFDLIVSDNEIGQGALVFHDGILVRNVTETAEGGGDITFSGNTVDRVGGDGIDGGINDGDIWVTGNFVGTNGTIGIAGREPNNDLDAITVGTADNVTISGNTIGNASVTYLLDDGIVFGNTPSGNGIVSDNLVQRAGDDGIVSGGNQNLVSITNNSVLDSGNVGILIVATVGNITGGIYVGGNVIDGTGGATGNAIQLLANATGASLDITAPVLIENNTIDNTSWRGVSVVGVEGDVSIVGNRIGSAGAIGGHGIFFSAASIGNEGDIFVDGNSIGLGSTVGASGVAIVDHNGDFTIRGNLIDNVTDAGISLSAATGNGSIVGNLLSNDGSGIGIAKDLSSSPLTIANNYVNDFAVGLFYGPDADVTDDVVFDNHLASNGVGVDHRGGGVLNASGNYWGFTEDDSAFDNYFVNDGTSGLSNGVNVDATPFLISGVDTNDAMGFQGDFSQLYVTALGQQVGSTGRVQEAVDLVVQGSPGSTIEIGAGTFVDTVTINRPDMTTLRIFGQGDTTVIDGQANGQPVISVTGFSGAGLGDLTISDMRVTGTSGGGGHGIAVVGVNFVRIGEVTFDGLGGAGVVFDGSSTAVTSGEVSDSTIDGVGSDGVRVLNAQNINIVGSSIANVGRDGVRVQANGGAGLASASLENSSIVEASDNGVNVIAGAGFAASVAFEGGNTITRTVAGDYNAVRAQGQGASFTLPVADGTVDLTLEIDASDTGQNFFFLGGGAMDDTVTFAYDVEFRGLTGALSSISTFGLMGADLSADQIAALFEIERHMVHEIDNPGVGLIRLIPDALFPTADGGLNGVQNAINASDAGPLAQDTVFLEAGTYADPSNQVGGGLNIDRNLRLIGVQQGISAVDGGRDGTDPLTESILDFRNASSAPSNGIRITDPAGGPGVTIDGLVVQIGGAQANGILIQTGSGARSDVVIANNFILGGTANPGGDNGIATSGANGVTGLTITGNVIGSLNGDGMSLDRVTGLIVQDNQVGIAGMGGGVGGDGIFVDRSSLAQAMSGNTIVDAGANGIHLDRSDVAAGIADNTVVAAGMGHGIFVDRATSVVDADGNTIDNAGSHGVLVARAGSGVTVTDNVVAGASAAGIGLDGIRVENATGDVLVEGNAVAGASMASVGGAGIAVEGVSGGAVSIAGNQVANGADSMIGGDGIFSNDTAAVSVSGNTIAFGDNAAIAGNGVFVDNGSAGAAVVGNSIGTGAGAGIGGDGVHVEDVANASVNVGDNLLGNSGDTIAGAGIAVLRTVDGNVSIGDNSVVNAGTFGIRVANTQGGTVDVADNDIADVDDDGISVVNSDMDVTVRGNVVDNALGMGIFVGQSDEDVVVTGNSIGAMAGSGIGDDAIRIATVAGNATASGNRIGNADQTLNADGLHVVSVTGNVVANSNTILNVAARGINVVATGGTATLGEMGAGNVVDRTGTDGIRADGTTGLLAIGFNTIGNTSIGNNAVEATGSGGGVSIAGNSIANAVTASVGGSGIFVDDTMAGDVVVRDNLVATAPAAILGGDGIHVYDTLDGDVTVSGNALGNLNVVSAGDGVDIFNTPLGEVVVTGNAVVDFDLFGIVVEDTANAVQVDGNTVTAVDRDAIFVRDTGINDGTGGVAVTDNVVASISVVFEDGIEVLNTSTGNVTVSGNSLAQGAGTDIRGDAIRITATNQGNVFVSDNAIGNAIETLDGDGIVIRDTTGAVEVTDNTVLNVVGLGLRAVSTTGNLVASSNTVDRTGDDAIRINVVGGNATASGNRIGSAGSVGGDGIDIDGVDGMTGVVVSDNFIASGAVVAGDAVNIRNVTGGGVVARGNSIGVAGSDNVLGGGILVSLVAGDVEASDNSIAGVAGGAGIRISNSGNGGATAIDVLDNSIFDVGDDGIAVLGDEDTTVTIDGNRVDQAVGNGVLLSVAGDVTISDTTVSNSGGRGFLVRDVADATLSGIASQTSGGAGLRLERTDDSPPDMLVRLEGGTFTGAGTAGIRVIDNDGADGGPILRLELVDGSGNRIENSNIGLLVDGADTRLLGNTLNDLAFANIGGGTGDYIRLVNAALYEDDAVANGAFNPTRIDATRVSFDGVVAGDLDPINVPADVDTLATLETRIVHYLDDATLGFVRLVDNIIVLPGENGLNGIQLAISVSSTIDRDTIVLAAGTFGDPSDLVPGGIIVDRSIDIRGAQAGIVATGMRDGVTGESLLDFANASSSPSAGFVIQASGVSIDGVSMLLDGSSTQGGIVIDNSAARDDIALVNNFVRGTAADFAGGPGITSTGGGALTGIVVTGNVVEFVDGNGIFLASVADPTVQNNRVGNEGFGATNVFGTGIQLIGTFSAPVSGNTIFHTDSSGIVIEGGGPGGATVSSNTVAHVGGTGIVATFLDHARVEGNAVSDAAGAGISVTFTDSAAILDNDLATLGDDGISTVEVIDATISGNSIANAGLAGINAAGLAGNATISDNSIAGTGTQGIEASNHTAMIVSGNSIANTGSRGILASGNDTGTVTVADNSIDTTGDVGILVSRFVNATISGNDLANVTGDGIILGGLNAGNAANATISNNSVSVATNGGDGITVSGFANVSITGNLLTSIAGDGIDATGLSLGELTVLDNDIATVGDHGVLAVGFANATVSGNSIAQAGADGIDINGIGGGLATVSDNVIADTTLDGILVTGFANVTANGNSIADAGINGIELTGISAGEAVALDNSIDGAGGAGILVEFFANANAGGNTVNDTGGTGIHLSGLGGGLATASGNTVTNVGNHGIDVSSFDTVLASGNSVANAIANGIQAVGAGAGSLTMLDNAIATVGENGILAVSFVNANVGGNAVSDSGLTGIRLSGSGGLLTVSGNSVANVANGDGIRFGGFPTAIASNNSIANVSDNGIEAVGTGAGGLTMLDNDIATVGSNGIQAISFVNATISGNDVAAAGLNGIVAAGTGGGNFTASGNAIDGAAAGDGIHVSDYANVSVSDNVVASVGGDGIELIGTGPGNALVGGNSVDGAGIYGIYVEGFATVIATGNAVNDTVFDGIHLEGTGAGSTATANGNTVTNVTDSGVYVNNFAGVTASNNSVAAVDAAGVELSGIGAGGAIANGNSIDGAGGQGIRISDFATAEAGGNTINDTGSNGIELSGLGGGVAMAGGNVLSAIGTLAVDNGIYIANFAEAVASNNRIDGVTGDAIHAEGTGAGNVTASNNSLSDVDGDGIDLDGFLDVVASGNALSAVGGDGITLLNARNVSIVDNMMDDVGHDAGAGIRLSGYTTATIRGNSIVNVTAMYGLFIENGAATVWPAANMLIAENRFAGSEIGIYTGANVSGVIGTPPGATVSGNTIGGNTIDGNRQWGIVVGVNGLSHPAAAGDPGGTYLDLLVAGNTIAGNGVPGDQTLATGGVRNDNVGIVLDARFNAWGDPSGPFAGPNHFDRPNPGGLGNAVSDWVLYDIPVEPAGGQLPGYAFPPTLPTLLDSLVRGGSFGAPGDVLAAGPSFTRNGNLLDAYFEDVFAFAFGLSQTTGGGSYAVDYAVCTLGDMWRATSCVPKPPTQ